MKIEFEPESRLAICYPSCESKHNMIELSIQDGNVHESDITLILPEQLASDIFEALREIIG